MTGAGLNASEIFANALRFTDAYHTTIQPLCEKTHLPPMAVDILMFLANNPGHDTAREVCRCRGFKPAIVSFHIERLAQEGYLLRRSVPDDRRKTALVCTEKAQPLIEEGRALQKVFAQQLMVGMSEEDVAHFYRCLTIFDRNIEQIRGGSGKAAEGLEEKAK